MFTWKEEVENQIKCHQQYRQVHEMIETEKDQEKEGNFMLELNKINASFFNFFCLLSYIPNFLAYMYHGSTVFIG